MARRNAQRRGNSNKSSRERILNAFDTAVDDEYYIKGLRQQQDIDLDHVSDERIRQLLSNQVDAEDDEEIDSDEAMGSDSEISLGEPGTDKEDEWGDSYDESELLTLSEIWDLDTKEQEEAAREAAEAEGLEGGQPAKHSIKTNAMPASSHVEHAAESEELGSQSGSDSDSDAETGSESGPGSDSDSDSAELELNRGSDSSDDENTDETLMKAIRSVSGADDIGTSSHRLAEASEENPFSLPAASSDTQLSLQEVIPGTKEGKTFAVPAPKRIQERADRVAALGLTRTELGKWADIVNTNRQAEHLQFPINAPPELQAASPFTAATEDSQNSLERNISNILITSALADENAVSTFEGLAPSTLSVEEVRKRRDQLRYMRELMYREEQRAKRIKKIKSKSFRKVHKRERERMQELENGEDDEESIEKAERDRALERATLRHRASSKWAKRMADQGLTRDAGTRSEIEEMLRQGDALKQKIRGSFESENESDGDIESEQARFDKDTTSNAPAKGVLGMKFMQEAEERDRKANERLLHDDYSDEDTEANIGRKSFNPAGQQLKRDLAAIEESGTSDSEQDNAKARNTQQRRNKKEKRDVGAEVVELRRRSDADEEGLSELNQGTGRSSEPTASKTQVPSTKMEDNPWLAAASEGTAELGAVKLAKSARPEVHAKGKRPSKNSTISVENTLGDSMIREKDLTLEQQDLVREAFAGDDVVADFEAEKQREVEEDGDKEIDETLPGWGGWSNDKPRVQKVRKVLGIQNQKRKDFKKGNVIINEKVNKKAAKFNASAVPFPFENRQQYERSLRMPLGQEWVTADTFQRQTKPRVLVKRGSVIDPIKKPHTN